MACKGDVTIAFLTLGMRRHYPGLSHHLHLTMFFSWQVPTIDQYWLIVFLGILVSHVSVLHTMLEWGYNKENTKVSLNAGMDLLGSGVGRVGGGEGEGASVRLHPITTALAPMFVPISYLNWGSSLNVLLQSRIMPANFNAAVRWSYKLNDKMSCKDSRQNHGHINSYSLLNYRLYD